MPARERVISILPADATGSIRGSEPWNPGSNPGWAANLVSHGVTHVAKKVSAVWPHSLQASSR